MPVISCKNCYDGRENRAPTIESKHPSPFAKRFEIGNEIGIVVIAEKSTL
jgi:hypothetical protein